MNSVKEIDLKMLDAFRENETLVSVLESAYRNENYLREGQYFGEDLLFAAEIDSSTGFWSVLLSTKSGEIVIDELEKTIFRIDTIDLDGCLAEYILDSSDVSSLKRIKAQLRLDLVFSNIYIDSFENRSLSEVFTIFFREIKRELSAYKKNYSFLWKEFNLNNATQVYNLVNGY